MTDVQVQRVSVQVADFLEDRRTAEIEILPGVKLPITYSPNKMTGSRTAKLVRYQEKNDPIGLARIICDVVIDWDLEGPLVAYVPERDARGKVVYDADGNEIEQELVVVQAGQKVPVRPEVVQHFPTRLLLKIWQGMMADSVPDPQ